LKYDFFCFEQYCNHPEYGSGVALGDGDAETVGFVDELACVDSTVAGFLIKLVYASQPTAPASASTKRTASIPTIPKPD
jgi:hypothetical protein